MTVVDFRSGGFGGVRDSGRGTAPRDDARYLRQDYADDYADSDWQAEDDWADDRFAADPSVPLVERAGIVGSVVRAGGYLAAAISVGVVLGIGIWGYQLVVRDVSGVPVIRAIEGEARTAPENPGGELSERTGLAVNAVAGGATTGAPNRVAIAPGATPLADQDVPMGELGATARAPVVSEEQAVPDSQPVVVAALTDAQIAARTADEQRAAEEAARAAALVEAAARDTVAAGPTVEGPVNEAILDENGQPAADSAITAALTEAVESVAVVSSPRPAPRPQRVAAVAAAPAAAAVEAVPAAAPAATQVAEAEPAAETARAKPASGAPLVQIGAFDSDAIAQSEWNRISGRYGDLFAGKAPVVVKHQAGGRTFWRLRVAGFDNRDDARRFCAALAKAGTDCIPATAQ